MNKNHSPANIEMSASQPQTPIAPGAKKKYLKPVLSEPAGLLETTKFFFQAANVGSFLNDKGQRKHS